MMSIWPLVTGSKVPGHRAMSPILASLLASRDSVDEHQGVAVRKAPFEQPVYWNDRHVSSGRPAQDHPAARRHNALTCDFAEERLQLWLLEPVGGVQDDQ